MNLSGRSYVIIALICLIGILELWLQTDIAWWRYLAAMLVAALAYEWLQARSASLSASVDTKGSLRLGRQETLPLRFANTSTRPMQLIYATDLPQDFDSTRNTMPLTLAGQTESIVPVELVPLRMGQYSWPQIPLRLRGALGLGWWPRKVGLGTELDVQPDLAGARGRSSGEVATGNSTAGAGAGMELRYLRQYVPGDPLRSIDWKATARSTRLMSRVYSEDQHLEIMLVLDIGRTSRCDVDGLDQFAHYVNLGARFAEHAAAQGDRVGMVAIADQPGLVIAPAAGQSAVREIRRALAQLKSMPEETDFLAGALRVQQLLKRRSLIILLTDLYGHSFDGMLERCLLLWQARHQVVMVGLLGNDIIEQDQHASRDTSEVFTALSAREYRNRLRQNAMRAQRLGAQSVVARPSELEALVLAQYRTMKARRRV